MYTRCGVQNFHLFVSVVSKRFETSTSVDLESFASFSLFQSVNYIIYYIIYKYIRHNSNRKAMNRNWSNQKANPALKTKAGNK